ncbi:MAG: hypothetical protein D6692_04330 [Planctomycetota bacterium]|nr:MAG: hypothetical protein D6692_04330 [Planctomycetota bacterium]
MQPQDTNETIPLHTLAAGVGGAETVERGTFRGYRIERFPDEDGQTVHIIDDDSNLVVVRVIDGAAEVVDWDAGDYTASQSDEEWRAFEDYLKSPASSS